MTAPASPRRWADWRLVPLIGLTAFILWLLVDRVAGAAAVARTVRGIQWPFVALAASLAVANLLMATLRWRTVVRAMGHAIPLRLLLAAVLAAWPLALIVPGRAGDVLRAVALRDRMPVWEGAGSVIAERAIDVQSLCVLAMVGTLIHGLLVWSAVAAGLWLTGWIALILLLRHQEGLIQRRPLQRWQDKLRSLLVAFRALWADPRQGMLAAGASLTCWLLAAGIVQALLWGSGSGVRFLSTAALWPIAVVAGMLPVTLAGMGTRDGAFLLSLQAAGAMDGGEDAVLVATLGYSLLATWMWALVGLPFALRLVARSSGRDDHRGVPHE